MGFIDAHCHLTDDRVWTDARLWIERALEKGVTQMRVGGLYPEEWSRQVELQSQYPGVILTSFGLHPWWIEKYSREEVEKKLAVLESQMDKVQAIGETGLDHFNKRDPKRFPDQEYAFRFQLKLAVKYEKPLVLHIVKAHELALKIIKEEGAQALPIQVHSYSGSPELAREWIKLERTYLSFSGGFLRENANRARDALRATPAHRVLFETDAPDQAWRQDGKNEPCYVPEIYEKAAKILNIPSLRLQAIVAENFKHFE